MANIKRFLDVIEQQILPAMESNYNIKMYQKPVMERPVSVTYSGEDLSNNTRVMFQFNSEYKDEREQLSNNQLFATVFYGFAGTKAGVIDINNINETVEILYSALYELGYRTEQDVQEDKEKEEIRKQKEKEDKDEEIKKARDKVKAKHELMSNKPDIGDKEDSEESEVEDDNPTFTQALDELLKEFKARHEINSNLHFTFTNPESPTDVYDIDVYYVTYNKALVQSDYLKLDKVYDINDIEEFLIGQYEKNSPKVASFESASGEPLDQYLWPDI